MINLTRVDTIDLSTEAFNAPYKQWVSTLIDSINESLQVIEDNLNLINKYVSDNGLSMPQLTTAQITTLAVTAPNGTFWYDTTTNQIKAKSNGSVQVIV